MHFLAMNWRMAVDYGAVTVFLYVVLHLARDARALRTVIVILTLHLGAVVTRNYELLVTSWVFEASAMIGVGVLIFAFHAELRYALVRFNGLFRLWPNESRNAAAMSEAVSQAAFSLAREHTGALIVLTGRDGIADLVNGGVHLGAAAVAELIEAIFQKPSPLHDGAIIIDRGDIVQARVVLPLCEDTELRRDFGTRHRAAIGLSQRSDAMVIVVSEQRGEVSVVEAGRVEPASTPQQLSARVCAFDTRPARQLFTGLRRVFSADIPLKAASAALGAVVLAISLVATDTSVRVVSVPVQFVDVAPSASVSDQSATHVVLQLRGANWLMESAHLSRLVAHFSLQGLTDGTRRFRMGPDNIDLPPGVVLEHATPQDVMVTVAEPHVRYPQVQETVAR